MIENTTPDRSTQKCDECGSSYFIETSKMKALCPECARHLYGYANCDHVFVGKQCSRCGWDGSRSKYIRDRISD